MRLIHFAQLILHIHLIALTSSLPLASAHLHDTLANNTTPLYRADWIQAKLLAEGISLAPVLQRNRKGSKIPQFLSHALRFPICDRDTLAILETRCLQSLQRTAKLEHTQSMKVVKEAIKLSPPHLPSIPALPSRSVLPPEKVFPAPSHERLSSFLPGRSVDVPKRLFRNLGSSGTRSHTTFDQNDLPYLRHVLDDLAGNADSSKGYALAKGVLARHLPLIRLLLAKGADPSLKDNMSIMLAIVRNDIELVKLLIERESQGAIASEASEESAQRQQGQGRKRKRNARPGNEASPGKKRRLEDRLPVNSAMLELAVRQKCEPLIQYFMAKGESWLYEPPSPMLTRLFLTGAVPNIKTLGMLQG